jgi:hypothetical protein
MNSGLRNRSLLAWFIFLVAWNVAGCAPLRLTIAKTTPEEPVFLRGTASHEAAFARLIFLSPTGANCPHLCTRAVRAEGDYSHFISRLEQRLQERGFNLISGAIVSRVEQMLKGSERGERLDRTEKALLVGKETGADAIFVVRALYVDQVDRWFLKPRGEDNFVEKPENIVHAAIVEWPAQKPSAAWYWLPVLGWLRLAMADSSPSRFVVPAWEARVEAQMLDLDGNIVWSGSKAVRSVDVIPSSWEVGLNGHYPDSEVRSSWGKKNQNFNYFEYYEDTELQRKQVQLIIDDLIDHLPRPGRPFSVGLHHRARSPSLS